MYDQAFLLLHMRESQKTYIVGADVIAAATASEKTAAGNEEEGVAPPARRRTSEIMMSHVEAATNFR